MTMKLASPNSNFRGRFPRQVQRAVPVYIIVLLILLFGFSLNSWLPSQATPDGLKYTFCRQTAPIAKALFPTKFWQIWKVAPLHFEEKELLRARNWTHLNPTYRYEVLTDNNALPWVEQNYGPTGLNLLDVVHFYRSLNAKIIKADLLRYLVMYVEGGTYGDIDVQALKPIDAFIPHQFKAQERDIDMVIGVEVDQPQYKDHPILGSKSMSFVQWTFMCKPRLPVMLKLINDIVIWIHDLANEQGVPISNVTLNFDQVISGSGPTKFTKAILSEMGRKHGEVVGWDTFHNMTEPKFLGGFLVLPVKAFAAGQGHSNSGDPYCKEANIKHHYHASKWPITHPRYKHPIYGQLEDCSWDTKCVTDWDANAAAFDKLAPEAQAKMIEDKEKTAREKEAKRVTEEKEAKRVAAEKKAQRVAAENEAALMEQLET